VFVAGLRRAGVGRGVEVDDGWQHHRDVAVRIGRWGLVNVRTIVEEHALGRSLVRVAAALRPTWWGVVCGILLVAAVATAAEVSGRVGAVVALLVGAVIVRAARDAAQIAGRVLSHIDRTSAEFGMMRIDAVRREARIADMAARSTTGLEQDRI
jgi:hypothetical protein